MTFECIWKTEQETEKWKGRIVNFKNYGSHYEIMIHSRSSIMVTVGKTSLGGFTCIPDFNVGCHLVDLHDLFWNRERICQAMGDKQVDAITVAYALHALANEINF